MNMRLKDQLHIEKMLSKQDFFVETMNLFMRRELHIFQLA